MLKKVIAAAVVAGAFSLVATPAFAAGPQLCYSVHVDVNGSVTDQAGCLPE